MTLLLLIFGSFSLAEGLLSLLSGFRFRRTFTAGTRYPRQHTGGKVSLIVPCRGIDPGLELNLDAFFQQRQVDYQILLVTGDRSDPCFPSLKRAAAKHPEVACRILQAGACAERSQKVHNLLYALQFVRPDDQILAFGDSDIRPHPDWLRKLIEPLSQPTVGAGTGFRWYVPGRANFASRLRSAWNAGILSLLSTEDSPFAWGGAMAIRRSVFEASGVEARWHHALSDDYALSRAVHDAGLRIVFQPECLSFSYEDCSFSELLRWSFRQMAITRVYNPTLWALALVSQLVHSIFLWGGSLALLFISITGQAGPAHALLLAMILTVYGLGIWKAWLRLDGLRRVFIQEWELIRRYLFSYLLSGPLTSLISLIGLTRSIYSREIEWRGFRYRMVSPDRTRVISR